MGALAGASRDIQSFDSERGFRSSYSGMGRGCGDEAWAKLLHEGTEEELG